MNTTSLIHRRDWDSIAHGALKNAVLFWFVVAMTGQWLFVYYVGVFYDVPTIQGKFEAWKRNKMVPHGYVVGDVVGNLHFAAHVLLAGVMTLCGTLQLLPQIRARVPALHRWSGRAFIVIAITLSLGGLYMVWVGGRRSNWVGGLAISVDAVLIITFGVLAWRYALARNFAAHRRWALRTFIVASGVWFMRVGYMAWFIINQGPVGVKRNGTGWFDLIWAFGTFLLPLAILELYFYAQVRGLRRGKFAVAGVLFIATALMAVGIFGAFMFMWRPLL
jgi:hypothetical protein